MSCFVEKNKQKSKSRNLKSSTENINKERKRNVCLIITMNYFQQQTLENCHIFAFRFRKNYCNFIKEKNKGTLRVRKRTTSKTEIFVRRRRRK